MKLVAGDQASHVLSPSTTHANVDFQPQVPEFSNLCDESNQQSSQNETPNLFQPKPIKHNKMNQITRWY